MIFLEILNNDRYKLTFDFVLTFNSPYLFVFHLTVEFIYDLCCYQSRIICFLKVSTFTNQGFNIILIIEDISEIHE